MTLLISLFLFLIGILVFILNRKNIILMIITKKIANQNSSTSSGLGTDASTLITEADKGKIFTEILNVAFEESVEIAEGENKSKEASELLNKLIEAYKNSGGKGSGSNQFIDNITLLLQNFQEFVSSLSLIQNLTLLNILIGTLILNSLITLIFIFYSDFLIDFFKLEQKFPRLSKFIKIRKNFQQFNFFFNIIIIAVVLMIYANYLMFINS